MTQAGVERRTLGNGLAVVAERRGLGPVVFAGVVYGVGSRDERPGLTGISHLLEHMMFKGTEKYAKGDVSAIVERNGGELNAFTSEDVTMYYEVFARDRWELALEIEAERMVNLRVDPAELEAERQVVLEERVMYLDIPSIELGDELVAAAFRESPYRWPIIGWENDIRAIGRDDLLAHYERFYAPENAAIVVVGDVDPEEAFAAAERWFGGIRPRGRMERRIPKEPELKGVVRLALDRASTLPHLQILFRAPELRTRDSEALSLLANVLSGTRTSRLDLALLETGKAGDVQVHYHPKADPSPFTVIVEGDASTDLDEVEEIVWRELEAVTAHLVEHEELERACNQVEAHQVFAMQSPSNRGFALGWHEAHGDVTYVDASIARLRSLTPADLQDVARRYFRPERCAVARIAGPNGSPPAASRAGASGSVSPAAAFLGPGRRGRRHRTGLAHAPAVQRFALANGVRVALQPDRTDPLVSVSLLFHGGSCLDPSGRDGLATLVADVVERGPRGVDFVEFSRRFERLGSHFSLAAGAELVHGDVTLLARHAEVGLGLVADVLEQPALRAEDLEIVRQLALNDLEAREDDLDDVAEDLLLRGVAEGHPYAKLPQGTREGLGAVTAAELPRFQAEAFRPDHAHLAIVGDVDEARILGLLEERFARLRVPGPSRPATPPLTGPPGQHAFVRTRADKAQAKICVGGPGLAATDPDRFPAIALNHVLGGSSIRSRLGDEIRDRAGLAYSVSSRIYERAAGGFFIVSLGTRPENVRRAVASVREEIAKTAEGVTEAELQDAKDYLTGSFPLRFTTYGRLARFWTRSAFYGWPEDYLDRYVENIRALSLADLRRVGGRLAASARFLSVAGPVGEDLEPEGGSASADGVEA